MSTSNAPDVDLKSRGVPPQAMLSAAAVAILACLLVRRGPGGEGAESPAEVTLGLLSTLLWGSWRLAQFVLFLILMLLVILVCRQRTILYVPVPPNMQRSPKHNPEQYRSPEQWMLPFEDVFITTADGVKINAWLVYQPKEACQGRPVTTLLYFHGNAGNIGHRLESLRDLHSELGVNILVVDYRGYGDSEDGAGPCEEGFVRDAVAAYRWLVARIRSPEPQATLMSEDRILIFGCSIGGAVSIQLAARILRERLSQSAGEAALPLPAGLVLENTFTGLRDMAVQLFPFLAFFSPLIRWPLLFDEWRSVDSLRFFCNNHQDWACCLLSGERDEIVPPEQMRELHSVLLERPPKILKFFLFEDGGHNDTPQRCAAEYWPRFSKFLELVEARAQERIRGAAEEAEKG